MTRHHAAGPLGLLLALAVLTGCGDDADQVDAGGQPSAQETTLEDCSELLPASVLDTLGWGSGTPTLDLGRCVITVEDGSNISVQRVPVPGSGQDAFDERCSEVSGEEVDWLSDAQAQCGTTGPEDTSTGVLVALTGDTTVIEARVDPRTATSPEQVQAALVEIVEAAAGRL